MWKTLKTFFYKRKNMEHFHAFFPRKLKVTFLQDIDNNNFVKKHG